MNPQLETYLDWAQSRGLKYPAVHPVVESSPLLQSEPVTEAAQAPNESIPIKSLTLYANCTLENEGRVLLERIKAFAGKYYSQIEIIERRTKEDETLLSKASERGDKVILFQLGATDALASKTSSASRVLVTAAPKLIANDPSLKRHLWEQMQIFLGIRA